MKINLVIIQPPGYVHSLCFLDTARYLRYHLKTHGIDAQISKNQPQPSMVNMVFGAHLGVPTAWSQRYCCVWFNQEQVGEGGAVLPPDYLELLSTADVIDYDPANLAAYPPPPAKSQPAPDRLLAVMPLLNAPFLQPAAGGMPIHKRPIDLLFFGSLNSERKALIDRIERCGVSVSRFDHPMYGPERDGYIAQAKAVLNIPFYGANRFEQVRVFNALSIGTPVVSLRRPGLVVEPAYEGSVHWFKDADLEQFFVKRFGTKEWEDDSIHQLENWRRQDPSEAISKIVTSLRALHARYFQAHAKPPSDPITHLSLMAHRHYRTQWFNTSSDSLQVADGYCDFEGYSAGLAELNIQTQEQPLKVGAGSLRAILIEHEPPAKRQLTRFIMQAAKLLHDEGLLVMECPLGVFADDPAALHMAQQLTLAAVRGAIEDQLSTAWGDWAMELVDAQAVEEPTLSGQGIRHALRLHLRRRECTPRERMMRRSERLDFGLLPEDRTPDR